jgi:hypothetical protein
VYCFDRAAKSELEPIAVKSKSKTRKTDGSRTDEGDRLLQEIMAEFSRSLGQGEIETNVFGSGVSFDLGKMGEKADGRLLDHLVVLHCVHILKT